MFAKSFRGKFGRNAGGEFARKIHRARLSGDLDITPKMEKEINKRFEKVFTKNGKMPLSVKERDIEKEILNPLRLGYNDHFSSENVDKVDKTFGFMDHTKRIGYKYAYGLQQEKKAKFKERLEAMKKDRESKIIAKEPPELKEKQKPPEVKTLPESSRLNELRKEREKLALEEQERRDKAMESKYGKENKESSEPTQGRFSGKEQENREVKSNGRGISNPASENHEGTPRRESLHETHIGPIKPPSEVGG